MKVRKVVVIGASNKTDRYSYQAVKLLHEMRYQPIPVHPKLKEILGIQVCPSLEAVKDTDIDTIALYVNPEISSGLVEQIIQVKPRRVIFNPNTENPELASKLAAAGIETLEACTLVMLRTGQF